RARANSRADRRRQEAREGQWREIRTARRAHSTATPGSDAAPWQRQGTSGCSTVVQCFAGHNIAAFSNSRCLMQTKILVGVGVLSLLLGSVALAGTCSTYCGEFAGFRWCNTTCR